MFGAGFFILRLCYIRTMKTLSAQERQNRIYRKMSAKKKAEITFDFLHFAKKLNPKYFEELYNPANYKLKKHVRQNW